MHRVVTTWDHHFSTSKIVVTEKTRQDLEAKVMEVWIKGQRVSFSVCETSGFKYSLGVFFWVPSSTRGLYTHLDVPL